MSGEYTLNTLKFMGTLTVARCGEDNLPAPKLMKVDSDKVFTMDTPLSERYFGPAMTVASYACGVENNVQAPAPELAKHTAHIAVRGREK